MRSDRLLALEFKELLLEGLLVLKHNSKGGVQTRVLWLDPSGTRLCVHKQKVETARRGSNEHGDNLAGASQSARRHHRRGSTVSVFKNREAELDAVKV
jgi:hypothetical protein